MAAEPGRHRYRCLYHRPSDRPGAGRRRKAPAADLTAGRTRTPAGGGRQGEGLAFGPPAVYRKPCPIRSEEHTSKLQSLMRISSAVFCLKKKTTHIKYTNTIMHTTQ